MNVTADQLKEKYQTLSYEKLFSLSEDSGLTDEALKVLNEVLEERKNEAVKKPDLNNDRVSITKRSVESHSSNSKVCITDIRMPFSSMVVFMVKWALASIPALIILSLVGLSFFMILGSLSIVSL